MASLILILSSGCTSLDSRNVASVGGYHRPQGVCKLPESQRFEFGATVDECPPLELLKENLELALRAFENAFGAAEGRFKVAIGDGLRTAYDPSTDTIKFPKSSNVIDFGAHAFDVQAHELFHNLSCRKFANYCKKLIASKRTEEVEAIAEALADYFAYVLRPDDCFGESFYKNEKCLRSYKSDLDYSLATGSHLKGEAILSYLISRQYTLADLRRYFESESHGLKDLIQREDWKIFSVIGDKPSVTLKGSDVNVHRDGQIVDVAIGTAPVLEIVVNDELLKRYPKAKLSLVADESNNTDKLPHAQAALKFESYASGLRVRIEPQAEGFTKYFIDIRSQNKRIGLQRIFIRVKPKKLN